MVISIHDPEIPAGLRTLVEAVAVKKFRCRTRADAGVIVTEYGVADLRGLSLARRRERMIAIAHPDHRAALGAAAAD